MSRSIASLVLVTAFVTLPHVAASAPPERSALPRVEAEAADPSALACPVVAAADPDAPPAQKGCCSGAGGFCGCSGGKMRCCNGDIAPSCACRADTSATALEQKE